jgi:hypothetical protein
MKLAFALSGKFFLRTLLLFIVHLIPFALMLTPITSLIMVFAGLSLPMILAVLIHEKASLYLISLGEKHD